MGELPEVQVLPRADHSARSEAQLHEGDLSNRPVRIRMPGGVAGAQPLMAAPYADGAPGVSKTSPT